MARTKRRSIKNRATKGCGKCKNKRCIHSMRRNRRRNRGSSRHLGGSISDIITNSVSNVFRGVSGEPQIPLVSF